MKRTKILHKLTYLASLSLILGTACDTLDQEPVNEIEVEGSITTYSNAQLAIQGVYNAMQSSNYYGLRYLYYQDVYTDNLAHSGTFTTDQEVSSRRINPSNLQIRSTWEDMYAVIRNANYVIYSLPQVTDADPEQLTEIEAEARFLRALTYYDLLKVFDGVPIITDFVANTEEINLDGRASISDMYDFIIDELEFAEDNMGDTPSAPFRATPEAATALLARVHLQAGNYPEAVQKATEVIDGPFDLMDDFGSIFTTKGNSEMILELNFTNTDGDQNDLALSSDPNTGGQKFYLRTEFYNSFLASGDEGDERFAASTIDDGALRVIKYFRSNTSDDNVPLIRLAEMYLIRAEANARQLDDSDITPGNVIDDINVIRDRANLDLLLIIDLPFVEDALEEILEQRRFELAFEGHRFADMRRYGIAETLFPANEAYRVRWPIPLQEREVNPNLDQNEDY